MWSSSAEHATAPPHSTLPAGKGAIDASGPRVFAPFHRSAAVSGGGASVVADEGRVWDLSAGETSAASGVAAASTTSVGLLPGREQQEVPHARDRSVEGEASAAAAAATRRQSSSSDPDRTDKASVPPESATVDIAALQVAY